MRRPLAALLLLCPALACGKYGPPLRAGEVQPEKPAPRFEVPLPPAGESAAPEPEPEAAVEEPGEGPALEPEPEAAVEEPGEGPALEPEPDAAVEEEPPPEGAP